MLSREQLRLDGLRAYELGRFRAAARIGFVLVPVGALCLLESRGRPACACVVAALLSLCVWLRWRDRRGFELVSRGLRAGSIPLFAGLLFERLGIECGLAVGSSYCTAVAALLGAAAGAIIGARTPDAQERLWGFITAASIAALAAVVGCVRLGVVGVVGVVAGIAFGTLVAAAISGNSASASR
jgi:hypothetical protein